MILLLRLNAYTYTKTYLQNTVCVSIIPVLILSKANYYTIFNNYHSVFESVSYMDHVEIIIILFPL